GVHLDLELHIVEEGSPILGLDNLEMLGAIIDVKRSEMDTCFGTVELTAETNEMISVHTAAVVQQAEELFTVDQLRSVINPDLDERQKLNIEQIMLDYPEIWQHTRVGQCLLLEHTIETGSN